MSKSYYNVPIDRLTRQHIDFFIYISKVGFVTKEYALKFGLNHISLHRLLISDYIIEEVSSIIYTMPTILYKLSEKSKLLLSSDYGLTFYHSTSSQLEHDYLIMKLYGSLTSEERLTWMSEADLQKKYPNVPATCDAVFSCNGDKIGVEVITPTYTKEMTNDKLDFIKRHCDKELVLYTKVRRTHNDK